MSFDLKKTKKDDFSEVKNNQTDDYLEKNEKEERDDSASDVFFHCWEAPEFEKTEKSGVWYLILAVFFGIIIVYAMATDSLIMAIVFILLGVVGYIHSQKEPRMLEFSIDIKGVRAGKELYPYDNIKSFWIFYEPPHVKTMSLRVDSSMMPFVHIPLANEDPSEIRRKLLKFINEEKQEPTLVDAIERLFGI